MNAPVTVEAGDKIGFTNEGDYGPISFNYVERHRTYFSKENVTNATGVPNYPLTGDVVQFDYTYLPAIFSIAVEVDPSKFLLECLFIRLNTNSNFASCLRDSLPAV